MKLTTTTHQIALQSVFVAPDFRGSAAGLCPQTALSPVNARDRAFALAVGGAGATLGHRAWNPLIT